MIIVKGKKRVVDNLCVRCMIYLPNNDTNFSDTATNLEISIDREAQEES
jgi:hypothetical protein